MNRREFLKGVGALVALIVPHAEPQIDNTPRDEPDLWEWSIEYLQERVRALQLSNDDLNGENRMLHERLLGGYDIQYDPHFKCVVTGEPLDNVLGLGPHCALVGHWKDGKEVWDRISYGDGYRPLMSYEREFMKYIGRPSLTIEEKRLAMYRAMIDNRGELEEG